MKISAAVVSRYLGQKFTRSEYHPSSQVKGWGTDSSGFRVWTNDDQVMVEHVVGGWRTGDADQKLREQGLEQYTRYLQERYQVERRDGSNYLVITAKEA